MPKLLSEIVSNTISEFPPLGVTMSPLYGMRNSFTNYPDYIQFQSGIKFHIMNEATKEIMYDFITATNFKMEKSIEDEGFYELAFSYILTAINDFNGHTKSIKGFMQSDVFYPNNINFENTKEAIRKAWLMKDLPIVSSN